MNPTNNLSHAQRQFRGMVLVALSGMLYGLMPFFGVRLFQAQFSVPTMLFWRFFIAMVWILGNLLVLKKGTIKILCDRITVIKVASLGAICYSIATACFFIASKETGTGLAMVVFFSFPVFVMLFSWLAQDWKINRYAAFALFAVIVGLVLLKGKGAHALSINGILLALAAAISYAVYLYGGRNSANKIDSRLLSFFVCLGMTAVFLAFSLLDKSFIFPHPWSAWCYILALGIFSTAVPIQLMLDGMKYIDTIKASMLSVLEPVVTLLVGVWLLHEAMSELQVLGVLIILSGVIFIQFEKNETLS